MKVFDIIIEFFCYVMKICGYWVKCDVSKLELMLYYLVVLCGLVKVIEELFNERKFY